jgi:hypothetical protein
MTGTVRLGAGAGFAGDRLDPAIDLARRGSLDHLVFECLGERTVALGQARKLSGSGPGYDPLLERRLRAVLPYTAASGTTVLTNAGAADPAGAAEATLLVARALGLDGLRVAAVAGDDVLAAVRVHDPAVWETGLPLSQHPEELVSANAYLGCEPIVEALDAGSHVVVTGRVADPSLYLGPLVHGHGWSTADADLMGRGTLVGHLLECAGQLTGGYYADPGTKPVPGLARLGFPFADVDADGRCVLGKLEGTGGALDPRTCAEQLLYEIGDPTAYPTPDVTADFSAVRFTRTGPDRVSVDGGSGRARPPELKVTLGFRGGWLGEGQISYAGPRCLDRARLAADVVRERLVTVHGLPAEAVAIEVIGAGAAFRGLAEPGTPTEVRLRVAARVPDRDGAFAVGWEVESLYTNGPAGGGGARSDLQQVVLVRSCSLPRELAGTSVMVRET